MSEVVRQNIHKGGFFDDRKVAEVVLKDGRTGKGGSSYGTDEQASQQALSRAIMDANSKPVPKK